MEDHIWAAALWIGYCALHSFLISVTVTRWMERRLKKYYAFYRLAYVVLAFVLLVPLIRFSVHIESPVLITYGPALSLLRTALIAASVLVFAWAFFVDYDALSFFGLRQILDMKRKAHTGQPEGLKKSGLLGVVRHPMYLTLIVFLWCQTSTAMDLMVNAILTAYVIIGTKLEERKLVLEFGDAYVAYQREVPMLLPFAHAR